METYTQDEVWMIGIICFFGGMVIITILAAILYLFDTFFYKPYRNYHKPLHYHVRRKL